jgi:hypothetical protein
VGGRGGGRPRPPRGHRGAPAPPRQRAAPDGRGCRPRGNASGERPDHLRPRRGGQGARGGRRDHRRARRPSLAGPAGPPALRRGAASTNHPAAQAGAAGTAGRCPGEHAAPPFRRPQPAGPPSPGGRAADRRPQRGRRCAPDARCGALHRCRAPGACRAPVRRRLCGSGCPRPGARRSAPSPRGTGGRGRGSPQRRRGAGGARRHQRRQPLLRTGPPGPGPKHSPGCRPRAASRRGGAPACRDPRPLRVQRRPARRGGGADRGGPRRRLRRRP